MIFILEDEINDLQNEQDMPIEELMKLYGYSNAPSKEETEKQSKDSKDEKPESENEEITEEPHEVRASTSEELEPEVSKGEKRSSSSPPPAKKQRSELAK